MILVSFQPAIQIILKLSLYYSYICLEDFLTVHSANCYGIQQPQIKKNNILNAKYAKK